MERLKSEGWLAFRSPKSFGVADVIAFKAGARSRLYECKSTKSTYDGFGPAKRKALVVAAAQGGCEAFLYWHPSRKGWTEIPSYDWPSS